MELLPSYLFDELPTWRKSHYDLGGSRDYEIPFIKTTHSSNTYITNVLYEWNMLTEDKRNSSKMTQFKCNLLKLIRPSKNSLFGICDPFDVRQLTRLRLGLSVLNEHKYRHDFQCTNAICAYNAGIEYNAQFFLHCPFFASMWNDLLGELSCFPNNVNPNDLFEVLLYGNSDFNEMENRMILEASIKYINATKRFN